MATINLGNIKFKWQGAYNGATAYTVDDVVSYNGSSYICIANSTGNLPTDTSYFEQMSSAGTNGTNGTDLTTTLTTQGDLVYRDGSGLQRLGAGTSGQVLQTGGAGANPSWGTLSSDMVLISTVTANNDTSVAFENVFSNTYNTFKIIMNGVYLNQSSHSGGFVAQSGYGATPTYVTSGNYYTISHYQYQDISNSGDTAFTTSFAHGYIYHQFTAGLSPAGSSAITHNHNAEFNLYNVNSTDKWKTITGTLQGGQANYIGFNVLHSTCTDSNVISNPLTGFKLFQNSNLPFHGTFKLYGLK